MANETTVAQFTHSHTLRNGFLLHKGTFFHICFLLCLGNQGDIVSFAPKIQEPSCNLISETLNQLIAEFDEQLGHELLIKLA